MPAGLAACFVMLAHWLNARDALHPGLLLQALDTLLGVMPAGLAACFVMLAHCLNERDALHPGLLQQALDTLLGVMPCQRGWLHALSSWHVG